MKNKYHLATYVWREMIDQVMDGMREANIDAWHTFTYMLPKWLQLVSICIAISVLILNFIHVDLIVAPIIKTVAALKGIFIEPLLTLLGKVFLFLSVSIASVWTNWSTILVSKGKGLVLMGAKHFSAVNLEVWLGKKGASAVGRFFLSTGLKWLVINILITQAFGNERRGIKRLPVYVLHHLKQSRLYLAIDWWNNASKRTRQIVISIGVCIVFVLIGQALLGFWILAFDLVWGLIVYLWSHIVHFWKILLPILQRLIPNFFLGFFSKNILRLMQIVPFIKNDLRVLYINFLAHHHVRTRYRMYKKSFLKFCRSHKLRTREKTRNLIPDKVRGKAKKIIVNASRHDESKQEL